MTSVPVGSLPSVAIARPASNGANAMAAAAPTTDNPPSSETLEREARLLAEARRAVQRGDGPRALAILDQHAREFPSGFLSSDRAAERIVVLCSLGRRDEAIAAAKVFLAGRPIGPLTQRVTTSCAGQP
jgi:RNA polymerase sigma-70 factor (ECF subfamily)